MSTTYFAWAFTAQAADLPPDLRALEDVTALLSRVSEAHLLMSASRNNWLLDNLRTLGAMRGLRHLRRLASASWVIPVAEVPEAMGEIQSLLGFAREAPESIAAALNPPCEAAEVAAAVAASTAAVTPHLGPTGADDGDGPQYLFNWLTSFHALLAHAQGSASCVVHVQPRTQPSPPALSLHTSRLDLIATTLVHLDAELAAQEGASPHPLEALLGARVPASWPPGLYDIDAIRFFRDRLIEAGPSMVGWYGWYATLRGEDGAPPVLVACGGYFGPPAEGILEIGYSVVPEYRGQGIASELIAALTQRAFLTPGVERVLAHTTGDNVASQRALRRAGFVERGPGEEPGTIRFERRQTT